MEKKQVMYFQIIKNIKNEYYWVMKAANHEIVCWSESYVNYANAVYSMNLVKDKASNAPLL